MALASVRKICQLSTVTKFSVDCCMTHNNWKSMVEEMKCLPTKVLRACGDALHDAKN
jgi:hypothetical protein